MLYACIVQDAVLPSRSCQDPYGSLFIGPTDVKNTVCLLLKFCPPGINPELMMECNLIAHPKEELLGKIILSCRVGSMRLRPE